MSAPARLETKNGVFEIALPEPVILGRLSVFYAAHRVGDDRPLLIKSFRGLGMTEGLEVLSPGADPRRVRRHRCCSRSSEWRR